MLNIVSKHGKDNNREDHNWQLEGLTQVSFKSTIDRGKCKNVECPRHVQGVSCK